MADDDLIHKAQQGDRDALEELFRREWWPVYAVVYHAVQHHAEAQDLTQEVFIRALKALDRYQQTGVPFRAYLATIARNLVRQRWRQRRPILLDLDHAQDLTSETDGPEDALLATESRARLHHILATLPADYQRVIRLRVLEERSTAEVATLMERSPGAIRQLLYRATVAARDRLREESPR